MDMLRPFNDQVKRGALVDQLIADGKQAEANLTIAQENEFNRKLLIIGLTGGTAVMHLIIPNPLFILNGLGYLALLVAHNTVPQRESYTRYTRDVLTAYTGFTFVGYFVVNGPAGFLSVSGVLNKMIELALMSVLIEERLQAGTPNLAATLLSEQFEA